MKDPAELPERWVCNLNEDSQRNECDLSQEQFDSQDSEYDVFYSNYLQGSVVWAKVAGYPWWPAMVEDDPDYGYFCDKDQSTNEPLQYHVVFFGKEVTRAWVFPGCMREFTGDEEPGELGSLTFRKRNYKREVDAANVDARRALFMTLEERLEKFGFYKRYKRQMRKEKEDPEDESDSSHEPSTEDSYDSSFQSPSPKQQTSPVTKKIFPNSNKKSTSQSSKARKDSICSSKKLIPKKKKSSSKQKENASQTSNGSDQSSAKKVPNFSKNKAKESKQSCQNEENLALEMDKVEATKNVDKISGKTDQQKQNKSDSEKNVGEKEVKAKKSKKERKKKENDHEKISAKKEKTKEEKEHEKFSAKKKEENDHEKSTKTKEKKEVVTTESGIKDNEDAQKISKIKKTPKMLEPTQNGSTESSNNGSKSEVHKISEKPIITKKTLKEKANKEEKMKNIATIKSKTAAVDEKDVSDETKKQSNGKRLNNDAPTMEEKRANETSKKTTLKESNKKKGKSGSKEFDDTVEASPEKQKKIVPKIPKARKSTFVSVRLNKEASKEENDDHVAKSNVALEKDTKKATSKFTQPIKTGSASCKDKNKSDYNKSKVHEEKHLKKREAVDSIDEVSPKVPKKTSKNSNLGPSNSIKPNFKNKIQQKGTCIQDNATTSSADKQDQGKCNSSAMKKTKENSSTERITKKKKPVFKAKMAKDNPEADKMTVDKKRKGEDAKKTDMNGKKAKLSQEKDDRTDQVSVNVEEGGEKEPIRHCKISFQKVEDEDFDTIQSIIDKILIDPEDCDPCETAHVRDEGSDSQEF